MSVFVKKIRTPEKFTLRATDTTGRIPVEITTEGSIGIYAAELIGFFEGVETGDEPEEHGIIWPDRFQNEVWWGLKQDGRETKLGEWDLATERLIERWDGTPMWLTSGIDQDSSRLVNGDLKSGGGVIRPGKAQLWIERPERTVAEVDVEAAYPTEDNVRVPKKSIGLSSSPGKVELTYSVANPLPRGVTVEVEEKLFVPRQASDGQVVTQDLKRQVTNTRQFSASGVIQLGDVNVEDLQVNFDLGNEVEEQATVCADVVTVDGVDVT